MLYVVNKICFTGVFMKKAVFKLAVLGLVLGTVSGCSSAGKWNEKSAVTVISREDGSGTRGAFIELFGVEQKNSGGQKIDCTTQEAIITNSTAVMLTSVAGDAYSIGYVSLGSLNSSVKALKIDGADATVENIKNGSYKISRPFEIVAKEPLSESAQDFVRFVLSSAGQKTVEDNKYISVSGGEFVSAQPDEKVVVVGSSSVSPVMEKLIEQYKTVNPNAKIELQTNDSTTGITNAANGMCDIAMSSRVLKESEKEKGLEEMTIAIDGIAVIVNKKNPVSDINKNGVRDVYIGKITKWNELLEK